MSQTSEIERLVFLIRVVKKELDNLQSTASRVFPSGSLLTENTLQQWISDSEKSERLDAYSGRFGRLQDTLGDKFLPALLKLTQESVGPMISNLDKAERYGWLPSADDWIAARKLRNLLVHEYIEDFSILTDALNSTYKQTSMFVAVANNFIAVASEIIDSKK